jgi:hypothetical protein
LSSTQTSRPTPGCGPSSTRPSGPSESTTSSTAGASRSHRRHHPRRGRRPRPRRLRRDLSLRRGRRVATKNGGGPGGTAAVSYVTWLVSKRCRSGFPPKCSCGRR